MKLISALLMLISVTVFVLPAAAQNDTLAPELEVFRPFLNKVWRGELQAQQQGKTSIDYSLWQRALNGQAIKVVHSVNNGEYGGESIIFWDKSKKSLAYYYFTTAGFYTHGTMQYDATSGKLTAEEKVENNANGITMVRSTSVLKEQQLLTSSEYLQKGQWVKGHAATYTESKDGKVVFQ
ncbi:MAG TPA: hypothetical protein DF774_13390 [Rheinheimera sp.]|uniref:hypothetical protein n=1 Tax=unclassified Rheinheimera TaxID=115860 RepID=UPI000EC08670|nr:MULTISPECIES: hypothetical protein [unclassified Rheinheimera]MCT6699579.1 hypothetical protein [Rheinheimera sp. 4Y26]HCU66744.1 hypothetical protein [Rheinheimera sp.]